MNLFLSVTYAIGLYGAYLAGTFHRREQPNSQSQRSVPYGTLLLTLAIAIPTTLQFFFPSLLPLFERNYERFLAGDWWRLVTSLFVQDGGIAGSIFNLVSLILVGVVAERLWGSRRWLVIFFTGGLLSQLIAFAWQPIGAGNSVANFSLAGSVAVFCLTLLDAPRIVKVAATLALAAGLILLLLTDIHGAAMLFGASIAWLLRRLDRHRSEG
jgi:membrane associated rhomboid family serine protease